jgi:hypothetical protein
VAASNPRINVNAYEGFVLNLFNQLSRGAPLMRETAHA